jgi:indole-3-glycerol phosphate synthase
VLHELVEGARLDAELRSKSVSYEDLLQRIAVQAPVKDNASLRERPFGHGLIAEIKRKSPSKGHLADIPDPIALAKAYEAGGATAISVLTESRRFGGSLDDLEAVAKAVSIPVLRKDFVTTTYQVAEARAYGADLVLLILANLDDALAASLLADVRSFGMTALVETHSEEEVRRAVSLGADVIGVNARDLATFELDTGLFSRLRHLIPAESLAIAESAVVNAQDVAAYRDQGADLVLVGEALVTGDSPEERVKEFLSI